MEGELDAVLKKIKVEKTHTRMCVCVCVLHCD